MARIYRKTGWGYLFKLTIIALIKLCCLRHESRWNGTITTQHRREWMDICVVILYFFFRSLMTTNSSAETKFHLSSEEGRRFFLWSSICSFLYFLYVLHTFLPSNSCVPCDKTFSTLAGSEKVMKPNPLKMERKKINHCVRNFRVYVILSVFMSWNFWRQNFEIINDKTEILSTYLGRENCIADVSLSPAELWKNLQIFNFDCHIQERKILRIFMQIGWKGENFTQSTLSSIQLVVKCSKKFNPFDWVKIVPRNAHKYFSDLDTLVWMTKFCAIVFILSYQIRYKYVRKSFE